jgi:hypothetical protein
VLWVALDGGESATHAPHPSSLSMFVHLIAESFHVFEVKPLSLLDPCFRIDFAPDGWKIIALDTSQYIKVSGSENLETKYEPPGFIIKIDQ